jgi:hypothetical protein
MPRVGFGADSYVEGGGLLNDVDATIKKARFTMFDYNGKSPAASPCLKMDLETSDGEDHEQYWSAGNARDWKPTKDGKGLESLKGQSGLVKSSNVAILFNSIIDAGFDGLEDDVSVLDGLDCHWIRIPAPERPGLKKRQREDGREYEQTVLIVNNINSGGGGKKKGASSGDVEEKATEVLLAVLSDNPDGVEKKSIPTKAFKLLKGEAMKNEIIKVLFDDEFLSNGPWSYEDGVVKG